MTARGRAGRTLHLLGAGRAGTAIARLLKLAGWSVGSVVATREASAARAVELIGAGAPSSEPQSALRSDAVTILGVPDAVLAALASTLSKSSEPPLENCVALHLSGALTSEGIAPLRTRRIAVGSLHPLYSFAERETPPDSLRGTWFGVEGDPAAVSMGKEIAAAIGGSVLSLRPDTKSLHHAAATMASNALVAVIDLALSLEEAAGVPRETALRALLPLSAGTLQNLERVGTPAALTGPIERGETEVLAGHLKSLRDQAPQCLELYRSLCSAILQVAERKGTLSALQIEAIRKILA